MSNLHKTSRYFPCLILVVLMCLQCGGNKTPAQFGTITLLVGNAQKFDTRSNSWKAVGLSKTIRFGDSIKTAAESRLEITFEKTNTVTIGENSKVLVSEVAGKDGEQKIQIFTYFGSVISDIKKLARGNKNYEVKTPTAIAAIRGTHFSVYFSISSRTTDVHVLGGRVWVINPFRKVSVVILPGFFSSIVYHKDPFKPRPINYGQWKKFNHLLKPALRQKYKNKYKIKTPLFKSLFKGKEGNKFKALKGNKIFKSKGNAIKKPGKSIFKKSTKRKSSKKAATKQAKSGKSKKGKKK